MLGEHGSKAISDNLPGWLSETSEMGCGDDITMLIAYFTDEGTPKQAATVAPANESEDSADV